MARVVAPRRAAHVRRERGDKGQIRATSPRNIVATLDGVYDFRRTCLLNELYYGRRLNAYTRASFWLEIIIVIGSATSGVSGWVLWDLYPGSKTLWGGIAGTATLLAAVKPVLHLEKKAQRYSKLFSAYRLLSARMADIVQTILETRGVSPSVLSVGPRSS
jgi:hypothetical protein